MVSLWQQVIESADLTMKVYGTQTVCRYGTNWQTAPACPHTACADVECTTCTDDWVSA